MELKTKTTFERTLKRNTKILGLATIAWVLSMALASFGPGSLWDAKGITALAIALNAAFGIGMMLANMRHIRAQDELQQKIQLIAMGVSLGVAVVLGLSLSLVETTHLLPIKVEVAHVVLLVGLTYMVTLIVAMRRYS